jgi:hypothetical protein
LFSATKNPATWPQGIPTNVADASIDVKYDVQRRHFVMFSIRPVQSGGIDPGAVELRVRTSDDGISWTDPVTLCAAGVLPRWSHNPGVSADVEGHLIGDSAMVSYGAPYGLSPEYNYDCKLGTRPYCRGFWDLYSNPITTGGKE